MAHPIYRVTHFRVVGPFVLLVSFTDGTQQRIDFHPVLHGPVFGPLRDPEAFNTVAIDPEVGTLTWANGADFDPATLHDWPSVSEELSNRARTWAQPIPQSQTR